MCGRDDNLRAELENGGYGTVIGWTDEMPALMTAADALVENAGGLTCMEAFAVGLPVITFKPIAGHGKDNAEMMARAGVNCYARDEDELHDDPAPGHPPRSGARRARRHRPAAVRRPTPPTTSRSSRETEHLVDRKGRVVALRGTAWPAHRDDRCGQRARALRRAHARRPGGLRHRRRRGETAQGRRPTPRTSASASTTPSSADEVLLDEIRELGASVVVDAQAATHGSVELEELADQGVDIANGGWGKGSFLRWNRARNDVTKAGKVIAAEAETPVREFCPGRRLDAFDQYYSRRQKQKLVQANYTRPPREPARRTSSRARSTCSTVVTATRWPWRSRWPICRRSSCASGLRAAPLGELR